MICIELKFQSFTKNTENYSKIAFFLCSRPKMAIFQIFQARFFDGHFFGLQEGSMKSEILLPPLVAFESLPSVSSLGWHGSQSHSNFRWKYLISDPCFITSLLSHPSLLTPLLTCFSCNGQKSFVPFSSLIV